MQQHTIGKRLAWAFGLMLALVVGMATVGLIATQRISYRTQVLYHDRAEPLQQLAELNQLVQRNQALVVDMLVNPGTQVQQHTLTFVQNTQRINSLWGQLNRPGLGGEEQAALQQWADARVAYLDQALAPANEAMANGRYDDAQELYLSKVAPQAGAMQMAMEPNLKPRRPSTGGWPGACPPWRCWPCCWGPPCRGTSPAPSPNPWGVRWAWRSRWPMVTWAPPCRFRA